MTISATLGPRYFAIVGYAYKDVNTFRSMIIFMRMIFAIVVAGSLGEVLDCDLL